MEEDIELQSNNTHSEKANEERLLKDLIDEEQKQKSFMEREEEK